MVGTINIRITLLAAVTILLLASLSLAGCENNQTPVVVIDIAAIEGVTAPAAGGSPVTRIAETAQYTGTVRWKITDGDDLTGNFAASTSYTATITLSPKTGRTLQGVRENFFTVAGVVGVTSDITPTTGAGCKVTVTFPITADP